MSLFDLVFTFVSFMLGFGLGGGSVSSILLQGKESDHGGPQQASEWRAGESS